MAYMAQPNGPGRSVKKPNDMLRKSVLPSSLNASIRAAALLVTASLGMTIAAQAGDETTTRTYSNKDKNVIQQPAPAEPKFYVDLLGSAEFDIHATQFLSNGNTTFTGAGGGPIGARVHSVPFETVHDPVVDAGMDVGYHVLPYLSIFANFTYSHGNGHDHRVGTLVDDDGAVLGGLGNRYDLYARLGDYQSYAGRAGVKVALPRTLLDLIHAPKAISPYFSLTGGGKYVESQDISFVSGTRPTIVDTGYGTLFGNSWVFTGEALFGYELKLTRNFSVVLEDGYGYDTKLQRGNLPGFNGLNRSGDRLYSTVSLGARIKF